MEYKPYKEYKDVDLPWLDKVPSHWEIDRGKNIFKQEKRGLKEEHEVITCFRDGEVTLRKNRRTTGFTESLQEIGYQGIKKGDLVIHQMDSFAGAIGVSDFDGKGSPILTVCNGKMEINNYYYAFIFREMAHNGFIVSLSRGIRERSSDFRYKTLSEQTYIIPPKEEQDRIVEFLDLQLGEIDRFIDLRERQIALFEEEKEVLIYDAVTKGIDKKVRYKDSGVGWLGEIPDHWEVMPVKRKLRILTDYTANGSFASLAENVTYLDEGYARLVRLTDLRVNFRNKGIYVSKHAYKFLGKSSLEPGDFLIANVGAYTGYTCLMQDIKEKSTLGPNMMLAKFDCEVNNKYMNYAFNSKYIAEQISLKANNSSAQPSINKDDFRSIIVLLPPLSEQESIVAHIEKETSKIDQTINLYKKQIDLIKEYRTSLISHAVTGQIDIRDFQEVK